MKKLYILLSAILLSTQTISAQDIPAREVPTVIIHQFKIDYPKAKHVEWERDSNTYNVSFKLKWNKDIDVWYNSKGKRIRIEEELTQKELPKAIKNALSQQFSSYRVGDIKKITENKTVAYKIEVEKFKDERVLLFNPQGKLIK